MKKYLFAVFLIFILIPFIAFADENIIKIISVHDGDTLNVINDNNKKYLTKEEVLKIIAEYNFISRTEFDLLKERVVELEEEIKGIK